MANNKGESENYIGVAKNTKAVWKKSSKLIQQHPRPIFGKKKMGGKQPKIEWKILERNIPSFNTEQHMQTVLKRKI